MNLSAMTMARLRRLPLYLRYLRSSVKSEMISASAIARGLGLGEVLVRKDLSLICEGGKPKVGYKTKALCSALENVLGFHEQTPVIVAGAGRLGLALIDCEGFSEYGLEVVAAFDIDVTKSKSKYDNTIYPIEQLAGYCQSNEVHIGIITVPETSAQHVCDEMVRGGITAIWNFARCELNVPANVTVRNENLALSLAYLRMSAEYSAKQEICENI